MGNLGIAGVRSRTTRSVALRPVASLTLLVLLAATLTVIVPSARAEAASLCGANINPVVCENQQPGVDPEVWDIEGAGDPSIQGFAADISVDVGSRIDFKIDTDARNYTIDVYRTGWYQGLGARKVASVSPSASLPQIQPECISDIATELYDCGTWGVSASWNVPADAVSGVYVARLERTDTGGASHITFIVRKDGNTSDVLFQTSDPTWHAYNTYGGSDFYQGAANGRAYKISYNRPFATRGGIEARDFYFSSEYATVRFLERNGYDVSYIAGLDTDRRGGELLNHNVFLSVGHDEYWSGAQRANIEAARDAGVNLQFLTGNEGYWRTRYEPSADSSHTADRTLVSYKETWSNAKIDPSSEWTGTWRDPRFASASQGGHSPENNLTGTMYFVNHDDLPVTVSSTEGKLRLWRNTGLSGLATGASQELAPHTVGYESNEDADNGFRPGGLIRLSTTIGYTPQYLTDYGNTVVEGTTEHHLTLYRAASGALVFSAASIQWGWGLDDVHDGNGAPADPRMQQAQVNLLADMGAQPGSLMTELSAATVSTDETAPSTAITTPAVGQALDHGATVTVTGTSSDVGGVVAGVEVSTDNGETWQAAQGTTSWSYTYTPQGYQETSVIARAIDDSANYSAAGVRRTFTIDGPYSVFGEVTPKRPSADDSQAVELGLQFTPELDGSVLGVRFYKGSQNSGTHVGSLWSTGGERLATVTFQGESASGWQTALFDTAVTVQGGTAYVVSYTAPQGGYSYDDNYWPYRARSSAPLTVASGAESVSPGVFGDPGAYPTWRFASSNYYVDALFEAAAESPVRVADRAPRSGAVSVPITTEITATFTREVQAGSVALSVSSSSGEVTGTVAYNATTRTVRFAPAAELEPSTRYTVAVAAVPVTGSGFDAGASWTFTTAAPVLPDGLCPCSLYRELDVPQVAAVADGGAVTLGMRFSVTEPGDITGIRFFKAAENTGTHTGTLWSATGERLAEVTFDSETASGWQSATFDTPVPVATGTEYVIAYTAPNGRYSVTPSAFAGPVSRGPISVPAQGGAYTYDGGFPSERSTTSYFVDVVFERGAVGPELVTTTPAGGAAGVDRDAAISAIFSASLTGLPAMTIRADGRPVAGTIAVNGATITFSPTDPLPYRAAVTVEVSHIAGTTGAGRDRSWSFGVEADPAEAAPSTLFGNAAPVATAASDSAPVELGTTFQTSVAGKVTAIRFFAASGDQGAHVGTLWSPTGESLAEVTFAATGAGGWQRGVLAAAVDIEPGQTYTVSYHSSQGRYVYATGYFASTRQSGPLTGFTGTYRYGNGGVRPTESWQSSSYFADVEFIAGGPGEPGLVISEKSPTGVDASLSSVVSAVLSTDAASPTLRLQAPGGGTVAGTSSYAAGSRALSFTPTQALDPATTYTAVVRIDGDVLDQWNFTTDEPVVDGTVQTLFGDVVPENASASDDGPVELGTTFTVARSGTVTAIRFYKGAANLGAHVGNIWDAEGNRLATVNFDSETASGWQRAALSTPLPVTTGGTYVVSYFAPAGHYAVEGAFFSEPRKNGFISAPAGANGRFRYGSAGGFPNESWNSSAYFVDAEVAFGATPPALAPPEAETPTPTPVPPTATPSPTVTPSAPSPVAVGQKIPATAEIDVAPTSTVSAVLASAVSDARLEITASGVPVAGESSYDAQTRTVIFMPAAPLDWSATYSAAVISPTTQLTGGTWSFTTVVEPEVETVKTIFGNATPQNPWWNDPDGVQVATRFTVNTAGEATGIRFYKGSANTGDHTGYLWGADGAKLVEISFANETADGWQVAEFTEPVSLDTGVEYRVGLHSTTGRYAVDLQTLADETAVGPFLIPANGSAYTYSRDYPASFSPHNYWVDVIFVASG